MHMPPCAKCGRASVLRPALPASTLLGGDQKFDIAFGTGDRAFDQVKDGPAFRFQPQPHVTAHAVMHGRVAHHALLADLVPLGLELRFDQGDEAGAGLRKGQRYRQHLGQRDEARVADERSEEHTSELQSLMRTSYAVFYLTKNTNQHTKLT